MVNDNRGYGHGGMCLAERMARAKALRGGGESRSGEIQCGRDSGNRAGGDAQEMSLVVWTEGGCRSFSHKLNDPSPASDMAMCTGQSRPHSRAWVCGGDSLRQQPSTAESF